MYSDLNNSIFIPDADKIYKKSEITGFKEKDWDKVKTSVFNGREYAVYQKTYLRQDKQISITIKVWTDTLKIKSEEPHSSTLSFMVSRPNYENKESEMNARIEKAFDLIINRKENPLNVVRDHRISPDAITPYGENAIIALCEAQKKYFREPIKDIFEALGIDLTTDLGQKLSGEFAKMQARIDGKETSIRIAEYGITDEGVRAEVAMLAAQQSGEGVSQYIKNYGINGQKALVDIAKIAAQQDGLMVSFYIQNYGIKADTNDGQKALVEIVKIVAQKNGRAVSRNIQNYGIKADTNDGQKDLVEIAKLVAKQNEGEVSKNIQNYGIKADTKDRLQDLVEIATLEAKQNGREVSMNIQNYGIDGNTEEGQEALVEIAKIAAKQNGGMVSYYIENYGIKGQKDLVEIAKIAAQESGGGMSEYIENYGIDGKTDEGQEALVKIAKFAAQQDGVGVSEFIQNYGIKGQKDLVEIAKIAAQESGGGVSEFIQNYGINRQEGLVQIAKLVAQQKGGEVSKYIKDYGINGQQDLVQIAKLEAQQNGEKVSEYIQDYGIDGDTKEGQEALVQIAKLAVQQCGWVMSIYIQNYGIKDEFELFEIAKLAAENDLVNTAQSIDYYNFSDKEIVAKLSNMFFNKMLFDTKEYSNEEVQDRFAIFKEPFPGDGISTPLFGNTSCSFLNLLIELETKDLSEVSKSCIDLCVKQFNIAQDDLKWLQVALKDKELFSQKRTLAWFINLSAICSMKSDLAEVFKHKDLLAVIQKRDPRLRETLGRRLILLNSENHLEQWSKLSDAVKTEASYKNLSHESIHAMLPCLVFSSYPQEAQEACLEAVGKIKGEKDFRDGQKQRILLEALLKIQTCSLEDSDKAKLIKSLFSMEPNNLLKALSLVLDLLAFGGDQYLIGDIALESLQKRLGQLFIEKFQVQVEDFIGKYDKTIGSWRKKKALITYVGGLNTLPKAEKMAALNYLKQIVRSILEGDFREQRYAVDENPHLAEIAQNHPEVFSAWKSGVSLDADEILSTTPKKEIPLSQQIGENIRNALSNKHLGSVNQDQLYPNLAAFQASGNLLESSETVNKSMKRLSRESTQEEKMQQKRLLIEKSILNLLSIGDEKTEIEKALRDLSGFIKSLETLMKSPVNEKNEFQVDIEAWLNLLRKKGSDRPLSLKVSDTDDPNDFILMGTEVENSCQRVEGDPQLNKCLLGYLVDGKHRLLLVKDADGTIVARSVLRILIDDKGMPVLFQERIYVADDNPEYPALLRKLALKKGASMNIPLTVSKIDFEAESSRPYPYSLQAKEKPIPFEYVDALFGIHPGAYTINDALRIDS